MTGPTTTEVRAAGAAHRVWRKGDGPLLGVLPGLLGYQRWTPFLDRLAERRTVIVPSLPGFPGGGITHRGLDTQLDWLLAVRDLLDGAGLAGADLVGISVGGALAADAAAVWPDKVGKLVLVSPLGVFDQDNPSADPFAVKPGAPYALLAEDTAAIEAHQACPEGEDAVEWEIQQIRANEAAARILWPTGDTGVARRLPRVPTGSLVVWGNADRIVPKSYRRLWNGPLRLSTTSSLAGAGHLADFDTPDELATRILSFLEADL